MTSTAVESIERACRQVGLKMTGPRRVVARVIAEMDDHPDVREMHRRAAEIDERISLATAYRTLNVIRRRPESLLVSLVKLQTNPGAGPLS